jgi:gas vesicle structural protein
VIASVDTYLRFAEAVGRLDIREDSNAQGLPQLLDSATTGAAKSKTKRALEGVKETMLGDSQEDDRGRQRSRARRRSR